MRVVFSAALVEALLESNVNFAHVTGNSAATAHVANYVSRTTDRMRKTFTTFPSDPNFGGWRAWLRGDGFFNAGYIYGEAGMPGQPMYYAIPDRTGQEKLAAEFVALATSPDVQ